jgi:hypothetical protein
MVFVQNWLLVDEHELIGAEQDLSQLFPSIKSGNDRSGEIQFRIPSGFLTDGCDLLDHGCPQILIIVQPVSDVDNEVDGVSSLNIKCFYIELSSVVVQGDTVVESAAGTYDKGAYAIALFGFVFDFALDADSHVSVGCPASNRGMLAVIAGVTTSGR